MARPLKKHNQNGNRYRRPPNIEASINEALTQDIPTLLQRADHLPSESLVHLIREAGRQGDNAMMNALLPILLARCKANLCKNIPKHQFYNVADLCEEALGAFSELFADDICDDNNDELDFFECRFNLSFRAFRINLVRREKNRVKQMLPLPNLSEEDEPIAYEDFFSRVTETLGNPPTQERALFRNDLLKAIYNLPHDERQAVVLCHIMGYAEESDDPQKKTAATLCGVTGRTIRNRLSRAAAKLLQFKE